MWVFVILEVYMLSIQNMTSPRSLRAKEKYGVALPLIVWIPVPAPRHRFGATQRGVTRELRSRKSHIANVGDVQKDLAPPKTLSRLSTTDNRRETSHLHSRDYQRKGTACSSAAAFLFEHKSCFIKN